MIVNKNLHKFNMLHLPSQPHKTRRLKLFAEYLFFFQLPLIPALRVK